MGDDRAALVLAGGDVGDDVGATEPGSVASTSTRISWWSSSVSTWATGLDVAGTWRAWSDAQITAGVAALGAGGGLSSRTWRSAWTSTELDAP